MKKLAIFSHSSVLQVNRDLYYQLASQYQVDLKIIAPEFWKGDLIRDLPCQSEKNQKNVSVVCAPVRFAGNGSFFYYPRNPKQLLKDWKPDLIFIDEEPWSLNCLQVNLLFPGIPKMIYTKQNLKKMLPPPFGMIQKYCFKNASKCFSVSDEVSEVLAWKGFKKTVELLPHSFDPLQFHKHPREEINDLKEKLGIPQNVFTVGYFGRLEPEKGILDLLQSIALIQQFGLESKIQFLLVGNGSLQKEVQKSALLFKNTTFIAAIPHHLVGKTMAAIDLLVLPSKTVPKWKEQFGRVLVEAMACGAATLGSTSGEIPNLIEKTGGGITFSEGNAKELADKIVYLLNSPKELERIKQRGYEYVHKHLTHESVAMDLGEMLDLVNTNKAHSVNAAL